MNFGKHFWMKPILATTVVFAWTLSANAQYQAGIGMGGAMSSCPYQVAGGDEATSIQDDINDLNTEMKDKKDELKDSKASLRELDRSIRDAKKRVEERGFNGELLQLVDEHFEAGNRSCCEYKYNSCSRPGERAYGLLDFEFLRQGSDQKSSRMPANDQPNPGQGSPAPVPGSQAQNQKDGSEFGPGPIRSDDSRKDGF